MPPTPTLYNRITWLIVGGLALAGAGLSIYGWVIYETGLGHSLARVETWLNIASRTLKFFFNEGLDVKIPDGSLALKWAQVLAPAATAGALIKVFIAFFATRFTARRIRKMKEHTVVCGASENARAFAISEADQGKRTVLVGDVSHPSIQNLARLHDFDLVAGDPRDRIILRSTGVQEAARLICVLPDDGDSLEVAMTARRLVEAGRRRSEPLIASIAIGHRQLWRQLTRSDTIERSRDKFEILPFNLSVWAARQFTWNEPLWRYAVLRGQSRIHAVFLGFDDYAEAMIGQIPPSAVHPELDRPRFTILSDDPRAVEGHLVQSYPQLGTTADVKFRACDFKTLCLDKDLMTEIAGPNGVTAAFVCLGDEEEGLSIAIMAQDAMRRSGQWRAPVYVRLRKCDGIGDLLIDSSHARRFVDVVQPFGVEERLCRMETIEGALEEVSEKIHKAYVEANATRQVNAGPLQPAPALTEWRNLPETYRASNRRSADHIPAKLGAAGCRVPAKVSLAVPESFIFPGGAEGLETLAELEHQSWVVGRAIDGWQYGASRDDLKKHHPDMVNFADLADSRKKLDRDQIKLLNDVLLEHVKGNANQSVIRHDHWIGLIGKNMITTDEAVWVREILTEQLNMLIGKHADHHFTLVTPLAPGSDYVMAKAAMAFFEAKDIDHHLLIVESVPADLMIEDYRETFERGGSWNGEVSEDGLSWRTVDDKISSASKAITTGRAALIENERTEWVIDLIDPSAEYRNQAQRNAGYQNAGEYVVSRTATLFAVHRPNAEGVKPKPGGTEHSLRLRKTLSPLPHGDPRRTITLDLDNREVREETLK